MKNKYIRIIAESLTIVTLAASLSGCSQAHLDNTKAERPVIKIGSDTYPPYNYRDENGVPTGIDVDLAKEAFSRMGYDCEVMSINWEDKTKLVEDGDIDCIWASFSMEGRLDQYRWAGPYMVSNQAVAVKETSDIYTLSDLKGKNVAVQSTTKPEEFFLKNPGGKYPKLGNLISLQPRELIYTFLAKDYADAIAAHETSIIQHMKDFNIRYRILDEYLVTVGIGVAFAKDDNRGIAEELDKTLEDMRKDGTSEKIIGKYLDEPQKYLGVDQLAY